MKTMNQNFYPVFQPKQILTHNALNNSFDYLNEQVALTRVNLIGTGIVCGLNVSSDEEGQIHISKGCGITSGNVRPVSQERSSCDINSGGHYIAIESDQSYRYCKKIQWDCLSRSNFSGGEVYELADIPFADDIIAKGKGYISIKELPTGKRTVVLCYESKEYSQLCGSCGGQSYTSPDNVVTIRPLLVVTPVETPPVDADVLNFISPLQRLNVEGSSVADIYSDIKELLKKRLDDIGKAITKAQGIFSKILKINAPSDVSGKIPEKTAINQNHYNFLCDLTEAYEEFRQCGEEVLLNQRLSEEEFPCHLILNGDYRHNFRPAVVDYSELNRLWERLVTMIDYFDSKVTSAKDNPIRLTPSVYGAVPLSEKAVPYYYHKTIDGQQVPQAIPYNVWTGRESDKTGICYWHEYYTETNWINYDLERYNFVRIEGHIGTIPQDGNIQAIAEYINNQAGSFKLPIQIIALSSNSVSARCIDKFEQDSFSLLHKYAKDAVSNIGSALITLIIAAAIKAVAVAVKAEAAANKAATAVNPTEAGAAATEAGAAATEAGAAATEAGAAATEAGAGTDEAAVVKKAAVKAVVSLIDTVKREVNNIKGIVDTINNKISSGLDTTTEKQKAKTAAGEVKSVAEKVKEAVSAKNAAAAIETTIDNVDLYLEPAEHANIENYKIIISFACKVDLLKSNCKEIISFLHWLDATRTKHQQCKEFSSFYAFKDKHPGLQHKSGVPIGGTFILVHDGEKVIADFCLPYRVTQPD